MRKFGIALAAVGSAVAFASPAMAQYYPQPQPYGQQYGYNGYNGYGHNGFGQVQQLQQRIDALQNRIRWMDQRGGHSADRLKDEARNIEKQLRKSSRYGLNPYELNNLQARIARLEQRVQFAGGNRYGRGGYGYNGYNNGGYNNGGGYYGDRDRDGRDDRYEDDQGYNRDH